MANSDNGSSEMISMLPMVSAPLVDDANQSSTGNDGAGRPQTLASLSTQGDGQQSAKGNDEGADFSCQMSASPASSHGVTPVEVEAVNAPAESAGRPKESKGIGARIVRWWRVLVSNWVHIKRILLVCLIIGSFVMMTIYKDERFDRVEVTSILTNYYNLPRFSPNETALLRMETRGPFGTKADANEDAADVVLVNFGIFAQIWDSEAREQDTVPTGLNWTQAVVADAKGTANEAIDNVFNLSDFHAQYPDSRYVLRFQANTSTPIKLLLHGVNVEEITFNDIVTSMIIISFFFFLIVTEIVSRVAASFITLLLSISLSTAKHGHLAVKKLFTYVDYATIMLLGNMMIIVEVFSLTGFFDFLAVKIYRYSRGRKAPMVLMLMLLTGFFSAFLDNVTTIMLVGKVAIRLCVICNIAPQMFLIPLSMFSNIGGAATPVGDPPNAIIISSAIIQLMGITFGNFVKHMLPNIVVVFIATMVYFWYMCPSLFREERRLLTRPVSVSPSRSNQDQQPVAGGDNVENVENAAPAAAPLENWELVSAEFSDEEAGQQMTKQMREEQFQRTLAELEKMYYIRDKGLLIRCTPFLVLTIVGFFFHESLHIDLAMVSLFGSVIMLLMGGKKVVESLLNHLEWTLLVFFANLFMIMGMLEDFRFLEWIGRNTSYAIAMVPEEYRLFVAITVVLWVASLASAFIDNIPLTTMMVKIIEDLATNNTLGIPLQPLVYALAFGACLGGNGSLIGASANVVAASIAQREGFPFTFVDFLKHGIPVLLLSNIISNIYLGVCHVWLGWN